MKDRIPACFQLAKYNISPDDVVRATFKCAPESIQKKVIVTPAWSPAIFTEAVEGIEELTPGRVYQLKYKGETYTLVQSGIGAPQTGEVILALGCTKCLSVLFTGSMAGLSKDMNIGDIMVVEKSICGDGFSRYLDVSLVPSDCFLQPVQPDMRLTRHIKRASQEICRDKSVPLHNGTVISIDSVLPEFFRLAYFVNELQCIGLEMETAAVFRAAKLVGIKAGAILEVSDNPIQNKSLYSGRTKEEMDHYRSVRKNVLTRVILESLSALK